MFSQLTVGERLKLARKSKGITQEELGEAIKVGKSQISNIEKGNSELTRANAIVLTGILGVELDWLLSGEGIGPDKGYSQSVSAGRNATGITQAGGNVSGNESGLVAELRKEIEHLNKLLAEKERTIQVLLKQLG